MAPRIKLGSHGEPDAAHCQKQHGTHDEDPHPDPGLPAQKTHALLLHPVQRAALLHHHPALWPGQAGQLPVLRPERRFQRARPHGPGRTDSAWKDRNHHLVIMQWLADIKVKLMVGFIKLDLTAIKLPHPITSNNYTRKLLSYEYNKSNSLRGPVNHVTTIDQEPIKFYKCDRHHYHTRWSCKRTSMFKQWND